MQFSIFSVPLHNMNTVPSIHLNVPWYGVYRMTTTKCNNMSEKEKMNVYLATATYVRAFFESYMSGVLDSAYTNEDTCEKQTPRKVKEAMLDHYGHVGEVFFNQMFYIMAQLVFEHVEDAVQRVRQQCGQQADIPAYLRAACNDGQLYNALVSEYRRNFQALLAGSLPTAELHLAERVRGEELTKVSGNTAIRLLVRLVIRTYMEALKMSKKGTDAFRQVSVLRVLSQNLNLLTHDKVLDGDFETLDQLLMYACGGKEGMEAMSEEMNRVMNEMI